MGEELRLKSRVSVVLVFFTALAIIGVVSGGYVVTDYSRARASQAWPVRIGVVLSERDGQSERIRYVYSVKGKTHQATRRRFFTAPRASRPDIAAQPGQRIEVFVNPDDPAMSVLAPGGAGGMFVILSIFCGGLVFVGVGGIVRTLESVIAGALPVQAVDDVTVE